MNVIHLDKNKRPVSIKQNPSLLPNKPQVFREPSTVLRIEIIAVDVLKLCFLSI